MLVWPTSSAFQITNKNRKATDSHFLEFQHTWQLRKTFFSNACDGVSFCVFESAISSKSSCRHVFHRNLLGLPDLLLLFPTTLVSQVQLAPVHGGRMAEQSPITGGRRSCWKQEMRLISEVLQRRMSIYRSDLQLVDQEMRARMVRPSQGRLEEGEEIGAIFGRSDKCDVGDSSLGLRKVQDTRTVRVDADCAEGPQRKSTKCVCFFFLWRLDPRIRVRCAGCTLNMPMRRSPLPASCGRKGWHHRGGGTLTAFHLWYLAVKIIKKSSGISRHFFTRLFLMTRTLLFCCRVFREMFRERPSSTKPFEKFNRSGSTQSSVMKTRRSPNSKLGFFVSNKSPGFDGAQTATHETGLPCRAFSITDGRRHIRAH